MRHASRVLLAAIASVAAAATAVRAEIKHEVRDEEIIATNLPDVRRVPIGRAAAELAARETAPGEPALPDGMPGLAEMISGSAARYGFDPGLIRAVVAAESGFDHRAVSGKGARGLMQLMPDTARELGVRDLHDPASNLDAGVAYLREMVARHGGDVTLGLAAYNAGPEAVARHGGVPPYEETRRYLNRIRRYYGEDLENGDWSLRRGSIRLLEVESNGVPHFTNLRRRRVVASAGSGVRSRPAPAASESPEE